MKPFKYILAGVVMGMLAASGCAQENNVAGGKNKPDVHITVHKKTDKNGNIVSYDSTYSYTYSGNGEDTAVINNMMRQFGASSIFFNPSVDSMPAIMNDPFFQQFNLNGNMFNGADLMKMQKEMEQDMQQMMQGNGYFFNQQPGVVIPAPTPPPVHKQQKRPVKKVAPQQNNSGSEGVQI